MPPPDDVQICAARLAVENARTLLAAAESPKERAEAEMLYRATARRLGRLRLAKYVALMQERRAAK
jgi:hypothetical protein